MVKAGPPAKLAPRGRFSQIEGVITKIQENWCQTYLADINLYPFWKKSMLTWPRPNVKRAAVTVTASCIEPTISANPGA